MLLRRRSEANPAEVTTRAAQEQGKFWKYHDVLYQSQVAENSGIFSDETLVGFAREAGLDVERFEESFKSDKYEPVVDRVFREGQDAGIQGTPTFSINGRLLVGAQPLKVFEQAIEEEVRKAENG
jgi:predicted DsbA family dithiol-disulfide isomerase